MRGHCVQRCSGQSVCTPVAPNGRGEPLETPDIKDAFHRGSGHRGEFVLPSFVEPIMDTEIQSDEVYETSFFDFKAYMERAKEMEEGIEPPPGFKPGPQVQLLLLSLSKI